MKALILGAGVSGKSANKLLKKEGYTTFLIDDNKKILFSRLRDRLFEGLSFVVLSPGVSIEHELVKEAKKRNIEVIGELELGARNLKTKAVAITGTNGKTTTTTLVKELFEGGKVNVYAGGNIGIPVTEFANEVSPLDRVVLEVSSFQLESIKYFAPKIACLLNITPDHLNRHKTMENYINAKLRIFENQTEKDFAVINKDDSIISGLDLSDVKSQKYYFSTKEPCKGCYTQNGKIYFSDGVMNVFIMNAYEIPLKGEHNLSNVLAALTCVILSGEDINLLAGKIHKFKGVSHRLEYVTEINGVTFINDSKATNISSTMVAMKAMDEPTTIILGGSDKGYEFDELFDNLEPIIKNIVVMGETKHKILAAAKRKGVSNVYEASTFKEAVTIAKDLSSPGETVLLSPACASFDSFKNYEARGHFFMKLVRELGKRENNKISGKKKRKVQT